MIKLRDLIFETPDRVYSDGTLDPIAKFSDVDARAFLYDHVDDLLYVAEDSEIWHTDMITSIRYFYNKNKDKNIPVSDDPFGIMQVVSDKNYEKITNSTYSDKGSSNRNDYVSIGYILGRYWKNKKIISFWNDSVEKIGEDKFKKFVHLFEKYSGEKIGDLKVEFMDGTQTKSKKEKIDDLIKQQHIDQGAKKALKDLGLYGDLEDKKIKEPEWKHEFRENKVKSRYSVENVYVNGKRVSGETLASSEKQAVVNIIIRSLEGSHKNYPAPHIMRAFELKGFRVKKLEDVKPVEKPMDNKKYWWQDRD